MTCAACSGSVERGLLALPGVTHAAVALTQGEAEVTYYPSSITADALAAAVEDLGFDCRIISQAGLESCTLGVLGMTCSACSASVEKALCAVPGVSKASVDALTGKAEVWYNPTSTGPRAFLDAVTATGFAGSLITGDENRGSDHKAELEYWRNLLSMALVFTIPVFILAMVLPMTPGWCREQTSVNCYSLDGAFVLVAVAHMYRLHAHFIPFGQCLYAMMLCATDPSARRCLVLEQIKKQQLACCQPYWC